MPYIKYEDRKKFSREIEILSKNIESDGELNYVFSSIIHKILEKRGINYQNMNNLIGSLECCKNEFLRVVVGPYEDSKKQSNGSVSNLDKFV
jgi:hypothetical protein